MDTLLETYSSPKLNQGKKDNLNRLIFASEIEPVIKKKKKKPGNKSSGMDGFTAECYQTYKKEYANHFHMLQKD